jgi:acyl-CoA dehydrogenase family protein 9
MTDASFLKSLFCGVIAESMAFPFPGPSRAESEETVVLLDGLKRFVRTVYEPSRGPADSPIPVEVLAHAGKLGLLGLSVPREYGGRQLSPTSFARVVQELGAIDPSLALAVRAHQTLGSIPLARYGTVGQKSRWLSRLSSGELLGAYALSEVGAGSDAAGVRTYARPDAAGWVLDGRKMWVTNGAVAGLFAVFARTSPVEEGIKPKLTAFLVERDDGVRTGTPHRMHGVRGVGVTGLDLDGVHLDGARVLGTVGQGFKIAVETLNHSRLASAAAAAGSARALLDLSIRHARERAAFGRPIGDFGLVKDKIASMLAEVFAVESMVFLTTGLLDIESADFSIESAACKIFASEVLVRVADQAAAIHAGRGYTEGSPIERGIRDARHHLVLDGTNEVLRAFIALSGMQAPGRDLANVARAMREPIKGFGLLGEFAVRKAKSAFGRERLTRAHPLLNREVVLFEDYVAELAKNAERMLRRHGEAIAEMQYSQRRIADLAIDLFALAAVLARTSRAIERRGEEGARREIDLATIFAASSERRMLANVQGFDRNDDELRKGAAARAYQDGAYPFELF